MRDAGHSTEIRALARDVAPLIDRLGRVLSDLAPHIASLANGAVDEDHNRSIPSTPPDHSTTALAPNVRATLDMTTAARRERQSTQTIITEDGGSRHENSATGPNPQTLVDPDPFRALVATPTRSPHLYAAGDSSGNIDIHIHAILTPLRNQAPTQAPPAAALLPPPARQQPLPRTMSLSRSLASNTDATTPEGVHQNAPVPPNRSILSDVNDDQAQDLAPPGDEPAWPRNRGLPSSHRPAPERAYDAAVGAFAAISAFFSASS